MLASNPALGNSQHTASQAQLRAWFERRRTAEPHPQTDPQTDPAAQNTASAAHTEQAQASLYAHQTQTSAALAQLEQSLQQAAQLNAALAQLEQSLQQAQLQQESLQDNLPNQTATASDTTMNTAAAITPSPLSPLSPISKATNAALAGPPSSSPASSPESSMAALQPVLRSASQGRAVATAQAVGDLVAKLLELIRAVVRWIVSLFVPRQPGQDKPQDTPTDPKSPTGAEQAAGANAVEKQKDAPQEREANSADTTTETTEEVKQGVTAFVQQATNDGQFHTPQAAALHSAVTSFSRNLAQAVGMALVSAAQQGGTPDDAAAAKTLEHALSQLREQLQAQEKELAQKLDKCKEGVSKADLNRIHQGHLPQQNTPAVQQYQQLHGDLQALQACLKVLNELAPATELVAQAHKDLQELARKQAEEAAKQALLDAANPADHAKLRKHFSGAPSGSAEGSEVFKKLAALHAEEDDEPNDEPPRERPRG